MVVFYHKTNYLSLEYSITFMEFSFKQNFQAFSCVKCIKKYLTKFAGGGYNNYTISIMVYNVMNSNAKHYINIPLSVE